MRTRIAKGLAGERYLMFWCLGCDECHGPVIERGTGPSPLWTWNGDRERPTLQPSILCRSSYPEGAEHGSHRGTEHVCHSFVTDGQIQFLGDCTHALKGQTVPIPEWPWPEDPV